MRFSCSWSPCRRAFNAVSLMAALLILPALAHGQYGAPELGGTTVPGEQYRFEFSGTLWNPDLQGVISSQRLGIIGSQVDFIDDLGFERTRVKDMRIVLRPSRRAKVRVQYTPIEYESETSLRREIVFNGQKFPLALPVQSEFDWKVWRVGFEYDVFYHERGFVGVLMEGRYTKMTAKIASPLMTEFTEVAAPLPSIGVVGRAYVIPEVALNFEMSMFRVPDGAIQDIQANYYDWDIHGTVNLSRHVGLQVGWRRMTSFLAIDNDTGDVKFQGIWFGAALRH